MKKKLIIFSSVTIALISAGMAIFFLFVRQEPVYIAVAAPLSGARRAEGEAMLRGISLYLNEANQKGGIDGRRIRLRSFNDKNRPRDAGIVASEIAENKDILIVLGHFRSEASITAGRFYRKNGIPAITASASANPVTSGNDWYFRIISDNELQGSFIAGYISKSLNKNSASIIFTDDSYGTTLAKSFEKTARDLSLNIERKWKFQPEMSDELKSDELKRIAAELRAMEDPGIIFMAVHGDHAPEIISSLKFPGTDYSIIGTDSFATPSFIRGFNKYPQEQTKPGYFTDGIYAVSPFLMDIANEKAHTFRQKFIRKYKEEPSWVAACYYDAAMLAVEAIRRSGVHGKENIRRDRREIREFMASMNTMDDAVKGVTGYIYFDKNGDMKSPFSSVVFYQDNKLFPAYSQYQMGHSVGNDALRKVLASEIIMLKDKTMNRTDVVYTGIDVGEISNLNVRQGTYTADFQVWFRYKGGVNVADIKFMNAVGSVRLEHPVVNKSKDNITVQSYHVKADFKNNFDFRAYPFDDQDIRISFRHASHTRDKLIYIPGTPDGKVTNLNPLSGWNIKNMRFYQYIITTASTPGSRDFSAPQNDIHYSQFNAAIRIQREGYDVILRNFLPVLLMALALHMVYFIPYEQYGIRVWVIMFSLAANSFCHHRLLSDIETAYWSITEYAIFTVYGLLCLSVIISIIIFSLSRGKKIVKIKQIDRAGKVLHFLIVLTAATGTWLWVRSLRF